MLPNEQLPNISNINVSAFFLFISFLVFIFLCVISCKFNQFCWALSLHLNQTLHGVLLVFWLQLSLKIAIYLDKVSVILSCHGDLTTEGGVFILHLSS